MKISLVIALVVLSALCAEAKPLKVLAIGNSFTASLDYQLGAVARDCGCELDYALMFIGGCSLERHVQEAERTLKDPSHRPYEVAFSVGGVTGAKARPGEVDFVRHLAQVPHTNKNGSVWCSWAGSVPEVLKAEAWDVVTIQQASMKSWRPETYEPWGDRFIALIRANAPQAKILVQQTWSYNVASPNLAGLGLTYETMYGKLEGAYAAFAAKRGLELIPSGKAVQLYRERLPVEKPLDDLVGRFINTGVQPADMKKADTIHLSKKGQYLQACVWVAKLFGSDLANAKPPKDLQLRDGDAERLRRCALDAVRMRADARKNEGPGVSAAEKR